MTYKELDKLANKFEQKLIRQAQEISQLGTTELFFNDVPTQLLFVKSLGELAIQGDKVVGTGPVAKILAEYRNKTENAASFSMDVTAEPKQGAKFTININPPNLKAPIMAALDSLYNSVVKRPMAAVQKNADQKAKEGHGSGTNHVQDLEVS